MFKKVIICAESLSILTTTTDLVNTLFYTSKFFMHGVPCSSTYIIDNYLEWYNLCKKVIEKASCTFKAQYHYFSVIFLLNLISKLKIF